MQLFLVRHGETRGNREGRYVGKTDEGLMDEAVIELLRCSNQNAIWQSQVKEVFVSPLKRCRQTAGILFPEIPQQVIEEFRECDFGEFEYCNYQDLDGNPRYQYFIDTFGKSGFPGGENRDVFQKRCVAGFEKMMIGLEGISKNQETEKKTFIDGQDTIQNGGAAALVIHGGTIMALLDWYSAPHKDYYSWQVDNGKGFVTEVIRDMKTNDWQMTEIKEL